MELSKYPVKGDFGDYQVELREKYVTLGMYQIVASVKVKRDRKRFYQSEFKELYRYETGWSTYKDWILNLVGLAQTAVIEHENTIRFKISKESAIEDFENWNGNLK